MDLIAELQEKYITQFSNNVPLTEFIVNILTVSGLAVALRWFYVRYGEAISNRRKFANNFLPLALGTLLIITIVKSSIALSLGLVGALSIVRFRSAIKDPEELVFLFITIGIGLAGGANQPVLAVIALVLILGMLFLHKMATGKANYHTENRMFVNVSTDTDDLERITQTLTGIFPYVELKRLDTLRPGLDLSFVCKADNLQQIDRARRALVDISEETRLSIVDQPDLVF